MTNDTRTIQALAATGYNRIPVMREVLADLDTPLSTYLKLADGPYSYLLESVHGGEKWGRYSIIGLPCRQRLEVRGQQVRVFEGEKVVEEAQVDDPLAWIEDFQGRFHVAEVPGLPRFNGGLVGYFGYDTVRYVEKRLADCPNPDPLQMPDILLMVSDEVVVFDNLSGKLYLIVHADPQQAGAYEQAQARLDELVEQLRSTAPALAVEPGGGTVREQDFVSGFTQEGFEEAVERIKEYIIAGDVMQVVLSQRMSIPLTARGRSTCTARCAASIPRPTCTSSTWVTSMWSAPRRRSWRGWRTTMVTVRPIAGTRPRGATRPRTRRWSRSCWPIPRSWPNT